MNAVATLPRPWYRQLWPWVLIAIPASSVAASFGLIYLALATPHALVVAPGHSVDAATERKFALEHGAASLSLQARLEVSSQRVTIDFPPGGPGSERALAGVERLNLTFAHPTFPERDLQVVLHRATNDHFRGVMQETPRGRSYVAVEPQLQPRWRLAGVLAPGQKHLILGAQSAPAAVAP